MIRLTFKETITREMEIPLQTLYKIIDKLSDDNRKKLLARLNKHKETQLRQFKKDSITSIINDFKKSDLYEDEFLKDLENGFKKSSIAQ